MPDCCLSHGTYTVLGLSSIYLLYLVRNRERAERRWRGLCIQHILHLTEETSRSYIKLFIYGNLLMTQVRCLKLYYFPHIRKTDNYKIHKHLRIFDWHRSLNQSIKLFDYYSSRRHLRHRYSLVIYYKVQTIKRSSLMLSDIHFIDIPPLLHLKQFDYHWSVTKWVQGCEGMWTVRASFSCCKHSETLWVVLYMFV